MGAAVLAAVVLAAGFLAGAFFTSVAAVSAGASATSGAPIAVIGNTGELTTGTHLHFELWHKGKTVDPTKYINF